MLSPIFKHLQKVASTKFFLIKACAFQSSYRFPKARTQERETAFTHFERNGGSLGQTPTGAQVPQDTPQTAPRVVQDGNICHASAETFLEPLWTSATPLYYCKKMVKSGICLGHCSIHPESHPSIKDGMRRHPGRRFTYTKGEKMLQGKTKQ